MCWLQVGLLACWMKNEWNEHETRDFEELYRNLDHRDRQKIKRDVLARTEAFQAELWLSTAAISQAASGIPNRVRILFPPGSSYVSMDGLGPPRHVENTLNNSPNSSSPSLFTKMRSNFLRKCIINPG